MKKKEGICMAQIYPQYLAEDRPYDPAYPISDNETLEYYTGDGCLWGQILVPAGSFTQPRPCVLLFHGFPGSSRNDDFAHALCRMGCVVLVPHHRGAIGSPGKYLVSNCIADIISLTNYVRSGMFVMKYNVDPDSIYLFGHSMGSNNVINAAKQLPRVRGLILYAPYDPTYYLRHGKEELLRELMDSARFLNSDGPDAIYDDIAAHAEEWSFPNAFSALKDKHLLCLSGAQDEVAPEHEMVLPLWNLLAAHPTEAVQRHVSYPTGHALMGHRASALQEIVRFLQDTL